MIRQMILRQPILPFISKTIIRTSESKHITPLCRTLRGFNSDRTRIQTIRQNVINTKSEPPDPGHRMLLVKPLFFSLGVSCVSFTGCAIWQYESLRRDAQHLKKSFKRSFENQWRKAGEFRHSFNNMWNNMDPAQKLTTVIIALNTLVFLSWRVPALQPAMNKYFTSNPFKEARCVSMLLSTFSHRSLLHLFANMYVMLSFSGIVCHTLGKEQFLAMFLSAGVFSSFASYAAKVIRPTMVPSLGASGAIMAMLGATCISYPDTRLAIAFIGDVLPHSFSADSAMKGLIIFDTVGLLMGWKVLDHAAHLGGMAFGVWYVSYGRDFIWSRRAKLMKWWHNMRNSAGADK